MLVQNRLYGVELPRLGLMNGAMGTIVGAYWPCKATPCAVESPVLLVRFPTYTGDPIYPHDPKVIPVGYEEIHSKTASGIVRKQCPVRLAHGITGHKSQGLSLDGYVVIDCRTTTGRASTATYGWAFVCWTRARHPRKVAFLDIPKFSDFLAAREHAFFDARRQFEEQTDTCHEATLRRFNITPENELDAHLQSASEHEYDQVTSMVTTRGIAEIPPCIEQLKIKSQEQSFLSPEHM